MTQNKRPYKPKPYMIERNKARAQDLSGQQFNELYVMYKVGRINNQTVYHCRCSCGKELDVRHTALKNGQKSCGCKTKSILSAYRTKHGQSRTKLFDIWHRMKERCYCKSHKSYKDYGGRGITICDEWRHDFEPFMKWAYENGYDPDADFMKCTIDRIDNDKGYSPENCRWVSMKEQCRNRRSCRYLDYNGEHLTVSEWSEKSHMSAAAIYKRLESGWSVEDTLTKPIRKQKNNKYRLEAEHE